MVFPGIQQTLLRMVLSVQQTPVVNFSTVGQHALLRLLQMEKIRFTALMPEILPSRRPFTMVMVFQNTILLRMVLPVTQQTPVVNFKESRRTL
jgi:hypothetical protein